MFEMISPATSVPLAINGLVTSRPESATASMTGFNWRATLIPVAPAAVARLAAPSLIWRRNLGGGSAIERVGGASWAR